MNIVENNNAREVQVCDLGSILELNFNENRTAFYGNIEHHKNKLWLVTFSCVALAQNPRVTYSQYPAIEIYKWVDVVITAQDRS